VGEPERYPAVSALRSPGGRGGGHRQTN
jgi:hypothetical protein